MPNLKISELTTQSTMTTTDLIPVAKISGVNRSITFDNLAQNIFNQKQKCVLKLPSAQSIPVNDFYSLNFGTGSTILDVSGMHSETTNNSRIVLQKTAVYEIRVFARWNDRVNTGYRLLQAKLNNSSSFVSAGNPSLLEPASIGVSDSSGRSSMNWLYYINAVANDYVNIVVAQQTGSNLDLSSCQVSVTEL